MQQFFVARSISALKSYIGSLPLGVAIGNFDGLHLGHQRLATSLVESSALQDQNAIPIVLSFYPHPRVFFEKQHKNLSVDLGRLNPILSLPEKGQLLKSWKIAGMWLQRFTDDFANQSPQEFVEHCLLPLPNLKLVVVGHDWQFGKARSGNAALLRELLKPHGIEVQIIEPVMHAGTRVSTSQVKAALDRGAVEALPELLGRRFVMRGVVSHGDARGRKLGIQTLNIRPRLRYLPREGVYITEALIKDHRYPAVSNLGVRPTFGSGSPRLLETHILSAQIPELYGSQVEVIFHQRLRDEQKFDSAEALRTQITNDIAQARKYFGI
ncbi:riboflavin biosynthesis protein RibF [bacterium]|nr:riboflavin biosynthesis protein RibF [bacterium]